MVSENKTLLVIDDVEENCELLKKRFEKRGFKVESASDGQEGLMALALNDINLVFFTYIDSTVGRTIINNINLNVRVQFFYFR